MANRDFNTWLSGFRDSIADYGYYIDFEKVHRNVDSVKIVAKNVMEYKKENPDTSILIITHLPKLLEYLKPDYVHVVVDGNIKETGGYELAKDIENNGYKLVFELYDGDSFIKENSKTIIVK